MNCIIEKLKRLEEYGVHFITFYDFKKKFKKDPFKYGKEFFIFKVKEEYFVAFNEEKTFNELFFHLDFVKKEIEKNLEVFFLI